MKEYIPWLISALMLLFSVLTYIRNRSKDMERSRSENERHFSGIQESILKANMKLDQVCTVTNDTRTDIKSMNKDLQKLQFRMTQAEKDIEYLKSQNK